MLPGPFSPERDTDQIRGPLQTVPPRGELPQAPRPPQSRPSGLGGARRPPCTARSGSRSRSQPRRSPEQAVHRHPAQRAAARPLPHQRGLHGAQQWFVGPEAAAQCRAQRLHPPLPLAGPGPRRRCRRRHRSFTASTSARPPRARSAAGMAAPCHRLDLHSVRRHLGAGAACASCRDARALPGRRHERRCAELPRK